MKKQAYRGLIPLGLCAAVLLTLCCWKNAQRQAVAADAWGLSFPQPGQTPVGNAGTEELRAYDAVFVGDTSQPVLYLTFDAGYENGCTVKILDTLQRHQVPAAFFLVGNYLEQNPELVRRMVEEGHTVGNHTYHHYNMAQIADAETFRLELEELEQRYQQIVGAPMKKYYRPPEGTYSRQNLQMAQDMGYRTVFWSLAYMDWDNRAQPTKEEAFEKLIPRVHNGAVVLLHSTSETNGEILDELLTEWKALGYRFGTLDELFEENEAGAFTKNAAGHNME